MQLTKHNNSITVTLLHVSTTSKNIILLIIKSLFNNYRNHPSRKADLQSGRVVLVLAF